MTLPIAVIFQALSSPKIQREESLIRRQAEVLGIPFRKVSLQEICQRRSSPREDELPVGALPFMEVVLKALGKPIPKVEHYPESLNPWLHRTIWRSSLGKLQLSFERGERRKPIFMKPLTHAKLFRGRIVYSDIDIQRLPYPESTKLWCSDLVVWVAEWRCYVIDGKIRDTQCYMIRGKAQEFPASKDSLAISPNREEMSRAVKTLIDSGFPRSTFTIDFGLLSSGETALIELDDAYSLGAYGLSAVDYFDFLWKGWQELTR